MFEIQIRSFTSLMLIVAISALTGAESFGQIKVTPVDWNGSGDKIEIIEMKVSPAAEPVPLFGHRLTHLPDQLNSGNAATLYLQSLLELRSKWLKVEKDFGEEAEGWSHYETPSDEIPLEKLRQVSARFDGTIEQHIARATLRRSCDWGYGLEELKGPMSYGVQLSGLKDTRAISRTLVLQTKLAILESRFDDAVDLMRMNYRLAENVGRTKLLVGSLIAYAEIGITNGSMIDFIAAADSPNMYWALTEMPRSLVDWRDTLRMECRLALRAFPEMADAETASHTKDEWSRIVQNIPPTVFAISNYNSDVPPEMKFVSAAIGILSYTVAKQRLIESGMDATKVEEMAVGQVLLIDASREYLQVANLYEKEIYLPFPGSQERTDKIGRMFLANESSMNSPGIVFGGLLLPAVQHVRAAGVRTRRDIDALRVIEALRMHAAIDGKLPKKLSDITVVHVPNNPATNKPFEYRLEGDTAVLELPRSDGIVYSKRFKVSLR